MEENGLPPEDAPHELSDKADIPQDDLQTMVRLYQKCPKLWGAFKDIGHVVHLMATTPLVNRHSVADGLLKIGKHIYIFEKSEGERDLLHFISVSGFVEKSVVFARQILRDMNKSYITELPRLSEGNVDVETVCLHSIRSHMLNCSADSPQFCLRLCRTGYLQDLVEDLRHIQHLSVEALERGQVFLLSLGTIHNCCMFPDSAAAVRQLDLVPHLTPFLAKRGHSQFVRSVAMAVLANVLEDDGLDVLALDAELLQYFLHNIKTALSTDKDRCRPWRTKEILFNLSLLARNDFNKRLMVAQGMLSSVRAMLEPSKQRSEEEKKSSVALLSLLIEDQINLRICQNYPEMTKILKGFPQNGDTETAEKVRGVLEKLERCRGEDPDDALSTLPHVADLLADQSNVLSIMDMGLVQFVVDEVKEFTDQLTASTAVRGEQDCGQLALLALADLAAQEGCRREIMARGGAEVMKTVVQRGSREDQAKAIRVLLELSMAPENRPVIQINSDLVTLLQDLKQRGDDQDLAQLAENVLLVLHSDYTKQGQVQ